MRVLEVQWHIQPVSTAGYVADGLLFPLGQVGVWLLVAEGEGSDLVWRGEVAG